MRRLLISLSLVLLAVAAPQRVFSQTADSSDLFLNAYMANEAGEQLENSGDAQKALSKYRYAASLLEQISHDDPKWQPLVVDYRKKRVSENIVRLQQQLGSQAPPPDSSPAPIEGELPQKDDNSAPDLSGGSMEPSPSPPAPQADAGASQQVHDQLDQLQNELRASREKLKSVENEKEELAGRLDDALKQLDLTKVSEAELKGQLKQAQDAYQNAVADHAQPAAAQKEFQKRISQLENALKDADADRDAADEQNDEYARRATRAHQVTETISQQRDQALADLGKARDAQKRVDQLLADNASLSQKVAADEKTIQDFKSESPQKDKQIADLRKEVTDTKALLTSAQQDRDNVQSSLGNLQRQYDSTSTELANLKASNGVSATEKKSLTDENDLLRGVVLRELKEQAHRDQTKRLVLSELSQLQVQSDTLLKEINYLGQPVVQLTDKEKALFKDAQIEIPDADESTMAISIAAPKQASSPHHPAPSPTPATALSSPSATPIELASRTSPGSPQSAIPPAPASPSPAAEKPESASTPGESSQTAAPNRMVPPDLMDDARDAKDAFERTEYRDAERIYEKMLTKAPNNVYILSNLGVVYFRDEKWKLAEESLKKAIAVAPEDAFSHCTLGIVYYQEKRYDDAVNSLTRALAINPKYAVAHNYLGITASQKGWQDAALKELETATDLDPSYADAYFNLAVVYAMQQPPNKQMAGKYYKRATDLGAEPDASLEQLVK